MMNESISDWRHISAGFEIPTESYSDQPFVVRTDDGAWLCALTTGSGTEGQRGQHIVVQRSKDCGRSWNEPVALEPPDGLEASYAVLLKVPTGRIYCLYNHNSDDVRQVRGDPIDSPDMIVTRVDSLGHYVFRYSDDHGLSWSALRYDIPVREFDIDRENVTGGSIKFFWNVGRPFLLGNAAYCSLHKVGGFGDGFFIESEGVLLRSENILSEDDPEKISWETLPEGPIGIRGPEGGGPIAEEHSYTALSDGTIYTVFRTIDGYPAFAMSRDGGRSFCRSEYLRYADGRHVKHPRAANFIWRCNNGRFIYWFHNHGGRFVVDGKVRYGGGFPYENRNPVWLCAGEETITPDGATIRWSEPEIALYDDDPYIRMSYPDMVEETEAISEGIFLTETQKDIARVHRIDPDFLDLLFGQFEINGLSSNAMLLEVEGSKDTSSVVVPMPILPRFFERDSGRADHGGKDNRSGVTVELWFSIESLSSPSNLIDWSDDSDRGVVVRVSHRRTIEVAFGDGQHQSVFDTDPEAIHEGSLHHLAFVFDGGPKIVSLVIDGRVQDGGDSRQFGWSRWSPHMQGLEGSENLTVSASGRSHINVVRVYGRALKHTECIGNYRAGSDVRSIGG